MEELLDYLVRALVDHPDEVDVESFEEDDGTVVIEIRVHPEDVGRVIGQRGRTIAALRKIIRASSVHAGRRTLVDVID